MTIIYNLEYFCSFFNNYDSIGSNFKILVLTDTSKNLLFGFNIFKTNIDIHFEIYL